MTISLSDNEEQQMNKRTKKLHDRPSITAKSKDIDYREENETEKESGESEEESSNEDKGIEDNSEDKMYRTRNPPKSLANIMSKLTNAQIKSLKDMGFGSFVGYKINRFPTALTRWLLLNYDPRTSVLQAGDVKIKITSQTVHDIFGLPMGGKEIVELNQAKKTDEVIEEWRKEMIASNKNIIAPDTYIETHETNAAKTTPKKESMKKSKIIIAKNAVSQSPIKAVNHGDISGKSSNGISNTPKEAQLLKLID
nr:peptidase S10, serine carboxypeptidase, alpha/beta hydrolase fold protein [Tanacetum cinerariifolium]